MLINKNRNVKIKNKAEKKRSRREHRRNTTSRTIFIGHLNSERTTGLREDPKEKTRQIEEQSRQNSTDKEPLKSGVKRLQPSNGQDMNEVSFELREALA